MYAAGKHKAYRGAFVLIVMPRVIFATSRLNDKRITCTNDERIKAEIDFAVSHERMRRKLEPS